ncbi:orexin receptor type 2 isoform X2 [Octopus bimaculoides]|uniref:G-protein coupled receptors family 1 profile domain-containing protein n=1 Tax=Octopus bimaculoides TaxID=37653 RepID=A0A0L8HXT7_OCTBM|nr:orexin receptor type 2 isoform X2 [Octopus bimaculoides]|eukprot:XP_014768510.1 PREDICTED: orexin receptor type 2-like isoform X2 [Octopus bimaculoides]
MRQLQKKESTRDISENQKPVFKLSDNFKKMDNNYTVSDCSNLEGLNVEMVEAHYPAIVFLVFEMILGATGNCMVAYIYYYKFEVSSTQIFIVALSIYDFLTSTISIPMEIVLLRLSFTFDCDTACRLIRFFIVFAIISSALIVIIIAVDRYILVCRPLSQKISIKNSKRILAVLGFLSFIFSIPAYFVYSKHERKVKQCGKIGTVCSLSSYSEESIYPLVYYSTVLAVCSFAFIALMIIYLLIGIRIWKIYRAKNFRTVTSISIANDNSIKPLGIVHRPFVKQFISAPRIKRHSMNPFKTTLVLFIITLIWTLSYLPHFIGAFWKMSIKDFNDSTTYKEQLAYHFFMYSYYINCAANPYIYGLFCKQFRSELRIKLRKIFVCCKK